MRSLVLMHATKRSFFFTFGQVDSLVIVCVSITAFVTVTKNNMGMGCDIWMLFFEKKSYEYSIKLSVNLIFCLFLEISDYYWNLLLLVRI